MFYLVIISFNLSSCFFLVNLVEEESSSRESPYASVLECIISRIDFFLHCKLVFPVLEGIRLSER
jgi:hypothetical protein